MKIHELTRRDLINSVGAAAIGLSAGTLVGCASTDATITTDPRLLARFNAGAGRWRIAEGTYRLALGKAADDFTLTAEARLASRLFGN